MTTEEYEGLASEIWACTALELVAIPPIGSNRRLDLILELTDQVLIAGRPDVYDTLLKTAIDWFEVFSVAELLCMLTPRCWVQPGTFEHADAFAAAVRKHLRKTRSREEVDCLLKGLE